MSCAMGIECLCNCCNIRVKMVTFSLNFSVVSVLQDLRVLRDKNDDMVVTAGLKNTNNYLYDTF